MVYIIIEGKVVIFQDFKYRMGDEDTLFLVNDKLTDNIMHKSV